jgi:hypothetical protein
VIYLSLLFPSENYIINTDLEYELIEIENSYISGILVDENKLMFCDVKNNRILMYSNTGEILGAIGKLGSAPGEFNYPTGICCYKDYYYIIDSGNNRVQVFTKELEFYREFDIPVISTDKEYGFTHIAVCEQGIYLTTNALVEKELAGIYYITNEGNIYHLFEGALGALTVNNNDVFFIQTAKVQSDTNSYSIKYGNSKIFSIDEYHVEKEIALKKKLPITNGILGKNNIFVVRPTGYYVDFYDAKGVYQYSYGNMNDDSKWVGDNIIKYLYMAMDGTYLYVSTNTSNILRIKIPNIES